MSITKSNKICRNNIARELSEVYRIPFNLAYKIVDTTFLYIKEELRMGSVVELRRFGTFYFKQRAEREARNVITGERVKVPQHTIIDFRPSISLKEETKKLSAN